ncbi:MAG: hypothetical protein JZU58_21545 [Curvibacter lanceolatus]|uniref:helix-turn-helix domain-containing protein n=1 Tax=Curvibacter lanceolatus TaxID=86182 RepID=UPI0023575845|nr:helix-turn-helix domain-containing protein [Curvibacter lanceolatus]MBV5294931.1 hypothetical protein [Curvibacter lanceolatus]
MAGKSENEGRDFMAFLRRVRHTEIPEHPSSFKLALLTMATYADSDGSSVKASVPTLARCCGLKVRQMQIALRGLQALGLIAPVANVKGGQPGAATEYRIALDQLGPLNLGPAPDCTPGMDTPALQCVDGCTAMPNTPAPQCIRPTNLPTTTHQGRGKVGRLGASDDAASGLGARTAPPSHHLVGDDVLRALGERGLSQAEINAFTATAEARVLEGHSPALVSATARVVLDPKHQGLRQFPRYMLRDPSASKSSPATKAAPLRQPRKAYSKTDYGRDTRSHGLSYDD